MSVLYPDGLSICRELRDLSGVPVVMFTARVDEEDRLEGFAVGAADCVCNPFSPAELVAHVRSVIRPGEPRGLRTRTSRRRSSTATSAWVSRRSVARSATRAWS